MIIIAVLRKEGGMPNAGSAIQHSNCTSNKFNRKHLHSYLCSVHCVLFSVN